MIFNSCKLPVRCALCPRECYADRSLGEGFCRSGDTQRINLYQLHFWEEPVLSGTRGSGAVFFSGCNMRCVYCQNYSISHEGRGRDLSTAELADIMIELQEMGAHNINLVTATHFTPLAAESIQLALNLGLNVPVVWNSSAYEKPGTLKLLEGLIDIYLPDFRYSDPDIAERYSGAPDYVDRAKEALVEMYRQAGTLKIKNGIAVRGLMIRLLILPGMTDLIRGSLEWISSTLGNETWISLMGQYYPAYRSSEYPEINRIITPEEYELCAGYLHEFGFVNGFVQEAGSCSDYTPDFK